ncbi:MAG: ATP-binding protein [Verrucomicrobiae bacterium]|nr:ATP-binding protein [Verrucomicrobiae bacterium]MCB1090094.1 ATP-binding protein [Verrucomicrobiae bacterium]
MSDFQPVKIKRRERDAVLQSLQAGLVPKQGLHLIQVGRKQEVTALLSDLERIMDDGAAFRIAVGRFGSGKSFFLNLIRSLALQQNLVVVQADFTMERRLYATGGESRALYSELVRNLALKSRPDGGALRNLCSGWISEVQHRVKSSGGDDADVERVILEDLRDLQEHVGGYEFAEVMQSFFRGHVEGSEALQASALRWLRGEYTTKTEARQDLGVRRIVDDESFYDSLKLLAAFVKKAGYSGLLVMLDELVVLSHRLPSSRARQTNYEAMLAILNDCVQGNAQGLGFIFAGTDECLEDRRRGLFSYEALRSRLAENELISEGLVDLSGPVIRLQPLSQEDLFVLLKNIAVVHANGDPTKMQVPDEAIVATLKKAYDTLGAEYFRTPRDVVRSFVGLLNILDQNPQVTWQQLLDMEGTFQKANEAQSIEEEVAHDPEVPHEEDDLASFRL